MAYDTSLERRIDEATASWDVTLTKRKMFSGLAYFVNGNMCFAIRGDELLLRLEDAQADKVARLPGIHAAVMGGRIMKSWLQAGGEAIHERAKLLKLLEVGRAYRQPSNRTPHHRPASAGRFFFGVFAMCRQAL